MFVGNKKKLKKRPRRQFAAMLDQLVSGSRDERKGGGRTCAG